MAQYDLTYSIDGIDSTLNVSEDGVYSTTIESDSPEGFNFVATQAAEVTVLDNLDGDFQYVVIFNLDATNFIRVRSFLTGDYTIDEQCNAGFPIIIPTRQYWGDSTAVTNTLVNAESIKVQADTADVNIKVYLIK